MEMHLCVGKHVRIIPTLICMFIAVGSLAAQSVSVATPGFVLTIGVVKGARETGQQQKTDDLQVDILPLSARPEYPDMQHDLSEEEPNALVSNQRAMTARGLSRKLLDPHQSRRLSDPGPNESPTYLPPPSNE